MRAVREISRSLYGSMLLVQDERERLYMAKVTSLETMAHRQARGYFDDPIAEAAALRRLGEHPNVAAYVGEDRVDGQHILYTEYVDGVDLFELVEGYRGGNGLPEAVARDLFDDVVSGLMHMRDRGLAHLDVSPENVMVDASTGEAKLIDLGSARDLGSPLPARAGRVPGKPMYMAPEIARRQGCADLSRADVWSLGVMLFSMLTGRSLYFEPNNRDKGYVALRQGRLRAMIRGAGVEVSEEAYDLMNGMLQPRRSRLTLEQVYDSDWLHYGRQLTLG